MPGVYNDLRDFADRHRACGRAAGDADPVTPDGYRVWARCPCGAQFQRWVTAADTEADLLRSGLLACDN